MRMTWKVEGGADLQRKLQQMERTYSEKVKREALAKGAAPIRQAAEDLAPYDFEGGRPHLSENIAVGFVSGARQERKGFGDETVIEVGPELKPDDVFYGYWQEFGTVHHPAQAFLRPAFDANARKALDIIIDEVWYALRYGRETFVGSGTTVHHDAPMGTHPNRK